MALGGAHRAQPWLSLCVNRALCGRAAPRSGVGSGRCKCWYCVEMSRASPCSVVCAAGLAIAYGQVITLVNDSKMVSHFTGAVLPSGELGILVPPRAKTPASDTRQRERELTIFSYFDRISLAPRHRPDGDGRCDPRVPSAPETISQIGDHTTALSPQRQRTEPSELRYRIRNTRKPSSLSLIGHRVPAVRACATCARAARLSVSTRAARSVAPRSPMED